MVVVFVLVLVVVVVLLVLMVVVVVWCCCCCLVFLVLALVGVGGGVCVGGGGGGSVGVDGVVVVMLVAVEVVGGTPKAPIIPSLKSQVTLSQESVSHRFTHRSFARSPPNTTAANDGGRHSSLPSPVPLPRPRAASVCWPLPSPSVSSRPPWLRRASSVSASASSVVIVLAPLRSSDLSRRLPALQQPQGLGFMDWSFVHKTWDKWASSNVGHSGHPLKAALLINYDPTGPSRLLSTIAEQEGIKANPMELTHFLDFIKRNQLQSETFIIASNECKLQFLYSLCS
ncbi:hypothetical protein Ahy_B06g081253 isoform B [Arachis hypogaea]|uniref:Uncharacterized protein n=1 Tax=Arachis hypogaea TaxID=3818 RepID=A0A444YKJ6_ARAHY|nr:hypothetical protein Ahy_B06g081253 isoform B [Arachis hypogaea]